MQEIKLYKSQKRVLLLLISSSTMLFLLVILISKQGIEIIYELKIIMILLIFGFLFSFYDILDRRAKIIINEKGISDRSINEETIKWECINQIYLLELKGTTFISIKTNNQFVSKNILFKAKAFFNKMLGGQDINLNITFIKVDLFLLNIFLNEMIKTKPEKREKLINSYKTHLNN